MKKLLALILALTLFALTLTSCDDLLKNLGIENTDDLDSVIKDVADITEEEWNDLKNEDNFNNFRFTIYVEGIRNIDIDYEGPTCDLRIDGDTAYGLADGGDEEETYFPADLIPTLRSVYVNTALAMLDNYSDFEYDEATNTYKSKGTISYEVNIQGQIARIAVDNVTVEFTDELLVSKIDCHMLQYIVFEGEEEFHCELNVQFIYSEYGEVELEPDPNALPPLTGGETISGTYYSADGDVISFDGNKLTRSYDGHTMTFNYKVENGEITIRSAGNDSKMPFSRGDGYVEFGGTRYTSTPNTQTKPGGEDPTPNVNPDIIGIYLHADITTLIMEIDERFIVIRIDGKLVEKYMYKVNDGNLLCVKVDENGNTVTDENGNVTELNLSLEMGDGYIVIGKDRYIKLLTANS